MARRENNKEKSTKSNSKQNSNTKRKQISNRNSSSNRARNANAKRSSNRQSSTSKKENEKTSKRAKKRLKFKVVSVFSLVGILMLSVLIAVIVSSTNDVTDKPPLFISEDGYVSGIDVSHHNGEIDWETVAKNTDFAIIRAGYRGYTEGKLVEDTNYKQNIKGAKKAEIPVGVYFYSQATTVEEAKEEASYVLSLIRGYDVSLPVFIDYEYAFNKDGMHDGRLFNAKLTPSEATDIINAFCDKINKGGHYAGLYASSSVLNNDVKTSKLNSNIYIWVADYNKSVKYKGNYDLWQYTKTGSCDGIGSKYTDLNYWYVK